MSEREELLEQGVFGKEVEAFLASNVGRYIVHRANEQAVSAMDKLKACDPEDAKTIRAIQNEIRVAEQILDWLTGAVKQGLQAINIIDGAE